MIILKLVLKLISNRLIFVYFIILDSLISCYIPRNGSLLTTTSKDKKLRVIDPRSTECLRKGDSHYGTKASKVTINEFLIVTNSIMLYH